MDVLAFVLAPGAVGLALWRYLVEPRLPQPDPARDPAAPRADVMALLGAFLLAWVFNALVMGVLANAWAPDASEAGVPAAGVPAAGESDDAASEPERPGAGNAAPADDATTSDDPAAPSESLLEAHGLAGVLSIQSTANVSAVLLLLALLIRRPGMGTTLGLRRANGPTFLAALAAWLAFLPLLAGAVWLNAALLEAFTGGAEQQAYLAAFSDSSDSRGSVLVWLAVVVVIPAAEELLYRGALFAGLRPLLGVGGAAVFSALAFGLQHDPSAMLPTTALGVLLAWLRIRCGSLAVPVVVHMLQNGYTLTMASLLSELPS